MPGWMRQAMIYSNLYSHDRIRRYKSLYMTQPLFASAAQKEFAAQRAALQARLYKEKQG